MLGQQDACPDNASDSLVGSIRELQAERDRLRGALERIAEIVEKLR